MITVTNMKVVETSYIHICTWLVQGSKSVKMLICTCTCQGLVTLGIYSACFFIRIGQRRKKWLQWSNSVKLLTIYLPRYNSALNPPMTVQWSKSVKMLIYHVLAKVYMHLTLLWLANGISSANFWYTYQGTIVHLTLLWQCKMLIYHDIHVLAKVYLVHLKVDHCQTLHVHVYM